MCDVLSVIIRVLVCVVMSMCMRVCVNVSSWMSNVFYLQVYAQVYTKFRCIVVVTLSYIALSSPFHSFAAVAMWTAVQCGQVCGVPLEGRRTG